MSYEIVDARNAKKDVAGQQNGDAREKRFILEPNSFEAFTYLYSFTGLFTGNFRQARELVTLGEVADVSLSTQMIEVRSLQRGNFFALKRNSL